MFLQELGLKICCRISWRKLHWGLKIPNVLWLRLWRLRNDGFQANFFQKTFLVQSFFGTEKSRCYQKNSTVETKINLYNVCVVFGKPIFIGLSGLFQFSLKNSKRVESLRFGEKRENSEHRKYFSRKSQKISKNLLLGDKNFPLFYKIFTKFLWRIKVLAENENFIWSRKFQSKLQ